MAILKLVPDETNVNFIGKRYAAYAISLILIIGSIALTARDGLNFGIDFTGGTVIEIKAPNVPDLEALRGELNSLKLGNISIQEFGAVDELLVRMPEQGGTPDDQQAAIDKVKESLDQYFAEQDGAEVDYRRTEFVGPQVGEELKRDGALAVLLSLAGIMVYIAIRFEWQFGVAAIVALAHDAIATIGLFAVTQMEFNLSTLAAILMIAGYSINDTVVVFDRIREMLRKYKKLPLEEIFNLSINQMLSRTMMTSVTTLLALVALWVFGGEVIQGFINALIFGIVIGTYSSVFVAAPVLMLMNIRRSAFDDEDQEPVLVTEPDGSEGVLR